MDCLMLERTEQVGTWGHLGERTEMCHIEGGPTGLCSVWGTPPPSPHETSVHCTLLVNGVLQKANPDVQIGQNRAEADKLQNGMYYIQEAPAISLTVGTTLALGDYKWNYFNIL